jgi:hypothetical protein
LRLLTKEGTTTLIHGRNVFKKLYGENKNEVGMDVTENVLAIVAIGTFCLILLKG